MHATDHKLGDLCTKPGAGLVKHWSPCLTVLRLRKKKQMHCTAKGGREIGRKGGRETLTLNPREGDREGGREGDPNPKP